MNPIRNLVQRLAAGATLVSLLASVSGCGVALPTSPVSDDLVAKPSTVVNASMYSDGGPGAFEEDGGLVSTGIGAVSSTPLTGGAPAKNKKPKKHGA